MKELNHPKNIQGFSTPPHFFMSQDEIRETVLTFLKMMTIKTALPSPNCRLCPKLKEMEEDKPFSYNSVGPITCVCMPHGKSIKFMFRNELKPLIDMSFYYSKCHNL